jgi:hypothetical protein
MMADAVAGEFDALVVWEPSRLSRQLGRKSALAVRWELEGVGVLVTAVTQPSTGNELADDVSWTVDSHTSNAESAIKSERVKRGKRGGVLEGVHQGAWPPHGYGPPEKRLRGKRLINFYEVDPAGARVVRSIFDDFLAGALPQAIADRLNDAGEPPPGRGSRGAHPLARRGDAEWHQSTVRSLLANPLLAGYASYRGRRVKGCACAELDAPDAWDACPHPWVRSVNVPAVVERGVWERVQRIARLRSTPTGRRTPGSSARGNRTGRGTRPSTADRFLLAGLAWCASCGERFGVRGGDDVYQCRGRRMGKGRAPAIPRAALDEAVRAAFVESSVDSLDVQTTLERKRAEIEAVRATEELRAADQVEAMERERGRAEALARRAEDDYAGGAIDGGQWARIDARVRSQIEEIDGAAASARSAGGGAQLGHHGADGRAAGPDQLHQARGVGPARGRRRSRAGAAAARGLRGVPHRGRRRAHDRGAEAARRVRTAGGLDRRRLLGSR